ncbi:MAG: TonB-dependent receptor [Candidatus Eisenbacteria bacterium]|nr:TonB-dependent receptor [Candidatus Eisenbacteria bacterium]
MTSALKNARLLAILLIIIVIFKSGALLAEEPSEMLLFQEIPMVIGALVETETDMNPVSITVIDEEMIRITPARNLYDLLEVYVPGFHYMTHFDASHMGLRGLIVDRDYSFLLLVNGRCVNQRSHNGATTELENWDLNDIELVEVIRGPGSVTYGPGAVAGVINITTKGQAEPQGSSAGFQYVSGYHSQGAYASHSLIGSNYTILFYGSLTKTGGFTNPNIYAFAPPSREAGYVGTEDGTNVSMQTPILDFYPDSRDKPQMKLYGQMTFLREWKLWTRYVNSGTSRIVCWTDDPLNPDPELQTRWFQKRLTENGKWENNPSTGVQQAEITLENNHIFAHNLDLKTTLSALSTDQERIDDKTYGKGNYVENYAESNLLFKSLLRFSPTDKLKTAVGCEFSYDHLGMGWGDTDKDAFIMDDGVLFVSGPNSPALQARPWIGPDQQVYRTAYNMYNYALLGEISSMVFHRCNVLLSGRLDKHQFSKMVLSPRLAVIYNAENLGLFKLSLQRSIRENTLIQLAATDYFGNMEPEQEMFNGAELMYGRSFNNFTTDVSLFYSAADLLGWNASGGETDAEQFRTTSKAGNLKVGGVEMAVEYATDKGDLRIGINHVYCKQLDFSLAEGELGSYISRSESHDTDYESVSREGYGNDRMNWANNMTKFHSIARITDRLMVYNSIRATWGYEGNQNWMTMYEKGAQGKAVESLVEENIEHMRKNDIFEADVRFDMSVSYKLSSPLSVTIFGQNITKPTKNWRYIYIQEGGAAIEEPTVIGLRAGYRF